MARQSRKLKVDQMVKQVVAQGRAADSPHLREAIKKDLISREVLIQEADKQNIGARADVKSAIDNARQSIIINAMLADYVKKNPVKDADVKAEYDKQKALIGDKEYHARHILVDYRSRSQGHHRQAESGRQVRRTGQAVERRSAHRTAATWTGQARPPTCLSSRKPWSPCKKARSPKRRSRSQFGYHVIKLEDVRAAKVPALEEVKQQVTEGLQQRQLAAYRETLVKKAKVQ